MKRPLLVALPAALAGFGAWVWLTGPGTSVLNALIAFAVAVFVGRLTWSLIAKREVEETAPAAPPTAQDRGPMP